MAEAVKTEGLRSGTYTEAKVNVKTSLYSLNIECNSVERACQATPNGGGESREIFLEWHEGGKIQDTMQYIQF